MITRFYQVACGLALTLPFAACATTPEPVRSVKESPVDEVIILTHAQASEVGVVLRELTKDEESAAGHRMVIVSHAASNKLLLSGSREQITRAKDVIARLDQPVK